VQAEYIKWLETEWYNRLEKEYKVTINKKLLNEIYKK
jgi:hypothetical protein